MTIEDVPPQDTLVLTGFPPEAARSGAIARQVEAIAGCWSVQWDRREAQAEGLLAPTKLPLLESLYRALDLRLFGPAIEPRRPVADSQRIEVDGATTAHPLLAFSRSAAVKTAERDQVAAVYVEYNGLPMSDLDSAIRNVLGRRGGMLCAVVRVAEPGGATRRLFAGSLSIDHRSFCDSVAECAAKLPAMLRGALARWETPSTPADLLETDLPHPQPLSASSQLWRLAGAIVSRLLWRDQWQIESGSVLPSGAEPGEVLYQIKPPDNAFWADPFLLNLKGRFWLIFEELPFSSNKGHISALELDSKGKIISKCHTVLSEPWHLSYPFLWRSQGRTFMIPDASRSRALNMYECADEPLNWKLYKTLISGQRLADATIVKFDGRLWMLATHGDDGANMNDTLHIYWADDVEGPWHAHALNPVKIDAATARPAGAMWVTDGALHRVVQDCSTVYGGAIHCMRVSRLTTREFAEERVPEWGVSRARQSGRWHTFNQLDGVMVLDRLARRFRRRTN